MTGHGGTERFGRKRASPKSRARLTGGPDFAPDLFCGVAGPVILNLELQEVVDGFQGFGALGGDSHLTAVFGRLVGVVDGGVLFLHDGDAGWDLVMDEHRHIEVVRSEHGCNVGQVHADLIPGRIVLRGLGDDADGATIGEQGEVMLGGLL